MILDLVVIGILLLSALVAFWRGFVREVLTIISLLGAAVATFLFGPRMVPVVQDWLVDPEAKEPQQLFGLIPYEMVGTALGFGLVFIVVLSVLTIASHLFSRVVHYVGLGPVDRSLGVVFGLIRGVVILGLMSVVLNFAVAEDKRADYFADSKTYPYMTYLADLTSAMMPGKDVLNRDKIQMAAQDKSPLEPGQANKVRPASGGSKLTTRRETDLYNKPALPRKFND
ncbi:MAG TPA: CvpA family protein [Alphaproteobacteria bacterium]